MSKPISYDTSCEKCEMPIEVMLYPRFAGRPPCNDPAECPECGHPILIEDIEQKLMEYEVAALKSNEASQ